MSESERVQRWRQQQRDAGKDAWTLWVPRELKLYIEDIALKRHCSPSDLVEQALTTCYPLSADATDTVMDTTVTDTSQIRLVLQQELRAFFAGSPRLQGIGSIHCVTDTVTDTLSQPATDTVTDTHTQAEAVAVDPVTGHVTDTVTDTLPSAGRAPCVTDTVTDTVHVTDTVTATDATPTAKRKATSRQRHVTAPVTDTVTDTDQALEPFDTTKYVLGKLCPRNHDYQGTGQSLLRRTNRHCCACDREKFQERGKVQRQTRRQQQRQQEGL